MLPSFFHAQFSCRFVKFAETGRKVSILVGYPATVVRHSFVGPFTVIITTPFVVPTTIHVSLTSQTEKLVKLVALKNAFR